jgi:hypothetical protein
MDLLRITICSKLYLLRMHSLRKDLLRKDLLRKDLLRILFNRERRF